MGSVQGYVSMDQVCLGNDSDRSSCVDEMLLIEVNKTEELEALTVNGVLGLSPGST